MPIVRRRIGVEERRARLASRHHLHRGFPAASPVEAARQQVGLHSSDPATVFLSLWARMDGLKVSDIEACLYEQPSIFRILGMRRTLFAVPVDLIPLLHHGCALSLAAAERRRLVGIWKERASPKTGHGGSKKWKTPPWNRFSGGERRWPLSFAKMCPNSRKPSPSAWAGSGAERWESPRGCCFSWPPRDGSCGDVHGGPWRSAQYRWVAMESRLPGGIPDLDPGVARTRLVEGWLRTYGPGTEADLKWWTGWPLRNLRPALAALDLAEVEVNTGPAWVMADDLNPIPSPPPWAALLPGLDPTVMGWRERHWYLGERWDGLFDRNGNARPTVWWCGRVVGCWGQQPDGRVVYAAD